MKGIDIYAAKFGNIAMNSNEANRVTRKSVATLIFARRYSAATVEKKEHI